MISAELKIKKIGNSRGIIFSKEMLKKMEAYETGAVLIATVDDNGKATLQRKNKSEAIISPFAKFAKFADVWKDTKDEDGYTADVIGKNKEFQVW